MIKLPENLPSPIGLNKSELLDILQTEIYGKLPPKPISVSASPFMTAT